MGKSKALRAHRYEMGFCEDPTCGVHVVGLDHDGKPICEIVMSPSQTVHFIKFCQDGLYEKAVKRGH
jgi:hypothetical protein